MAAPISSPGARRPATVGRQHPAQALGAVLHLDCLCERNAVSGNPVDGVKRPIANGNEGSTPALGDAPAPTSWRRRRRTRQANLSGSIAPNPPGYLSRVSRTSASGQLRWADERGLDRRRRADEFGYAVAARVRHPDVARAVDRHAPWVVKVRPGGGKVALSASRRCSARLRYCRSRFATQTRPELSTATPNGRLKFDPAEAKLPFSVQSLFNAVTLLCFRYLFATQTCPGLSTATPNGRLKFDPAGANLPFNVPSLFSAVMVSPPTVSDPDVARAIDRHAQWEY